MIHTLLSLFLLLTSSVMAAVEVFPSIMKGVARGSRVFQVHNPLEFDGIRKSALLRAGSGIPYYGIYHLSPNAVYPNKPEMNGFSFVTNHVPLDKLWKRMQRNEEGFGNVLDASLCKRDRQELIPEFLRIEDDSRAGSLVMSPGRAFTPLHVDPKVYPESRHSGVWMYLVEGSKEWCFVPRAAVDESPDVLRKLRAMDIDHLSKHFGSNVSRAVMKAGDFVFFEGQTLYHAVKTGSKPALGLSGFCSFDNAPW